MLETIDRYAPGDPTQRLAVAVVAAVTGILAVGDALNVIYFPMFQLGLPDSALANLLVLVFGVALLVVTYRLVELSVGDGHTLVTRPTAADGGYDDRDPGQILEARYARGELDDEQFERMRIRLSDFEKSGGATEENYADARDFAENHELHDRETVID
jgi:uncharacterized membrane protein